MSERERFEEWAKSVPHYRLLEPDDEHNCSAKSAAWQAWKAARAWRPIETAPKDGTRILLCSNGGAVWMGLWRTDDEPPYGKAGWTRFNCVDVGWEPDNWMPLPPPPEGE